MKTAVKLLSQVSLTWSADNQEKQPSNKWEPFSNWGRIRQQKERVPLTPNPLQLPRYGKPLSVYHITTCNQVGKGYRQYEKQ